MDYAALKLLHMGCAATSAALFVARGAAMWRQAPWPRALRALPHMVDTVLLGSAVTLAVWSGQAPWSHPWLAAKLGALLLYIALGSIALRPDGTTRRPLAVRRAALVAALAVLAYIVSVAVTRQPWPLA